MIPTLKVEINWIIEKARCCAKTIAGFPYLLHVYDRFYFKHYKFVLNKHHLGIPLEALFNSSLNGAISLRCS